jgi:hypothetical protein
MYCCAGFEKLNRKKMTPSNKDFTKAIGRIIVQFGNLTRLIQSGKMEKVFSITKSINMLDNEIPESFRALINDWQLADKRIKDSKFVQAAKVFAVAG